MGEVPLYRRSGTQSIEMCLMRSIRRNEAELGYLRLIDFCITQL